MARAETRTLLSLDRFAAVVGIHPLHFNQVHVEEIADAHTCDMPLFQYSWQMADKTGREEIANAIADAETRLAAVLGFDVAPRWHADEPARVSRTGVPEYSAAWRGLRGLPAVHTQYGYVISGGQEAKSVVSAGAAVVYSDADGDTYKETATVTVATTVTDSEELAIYYPGHAGDEAWRIRPITVSIAGGIATIKCRREQLVIEAQLETLAPAAVDGLNNALFLTTVDVYRVYNDPSMQVRFVWEGTDCDDGVGPGVVSTQDGVFVTRDPKLGIIAPETATWNAATGEFDAIGAACCIARAPDRLRLWYRAGWRYRGSVLRVDPMWERAVSYLALSTLDRPLCACQPLAAYMDKWRVDLAEHNPGRSFSMSRRMLDNPLGTTRGEVTAWSLAREYVVVDGVPHG
jgi:hypothetical protein